MNSFTNLVYSDGADTRAVRLVMREGEPWFVLADLCAILGLEHPRDVLRRLDDDERGVVSIHTPGGEQGVNAVSEPGLYSVILGARANDRTRAFKRWVTREVLPTIRKTGTYSVIPAPARPISAAQHLLEQAQVLVALEARTDALEQQLADEPLRSTELNRIYRLGQRLANVMGSYPKAWRVFKDRFQLASYRDLPRREYETGVLFLERQIAAYTGGGQDHLMG